MFQFTLVTKTVEIQNGDTVVAILECRQATYAEDMKMSSMALEARLQNKAETSLIVEKKEEVSADQKRWFYFRENIYPKLAACTTCKDGLIPTAEEAYSMPSSELNKWYFIAEQVNKPWFDEFRHITEAMLKAIEKMPSATPEYQELKKKEPKPAK